MLIYLRQQHNTPSRKPSIWLPLLAVLFPLEKVMVKPVQVHLSWGTCCFFFVESEWKEMVEFRGISPGRQPQAIHAVPDTTPKTHCSFSHEFHSLSRSEEHTADNNTYSIIHTASSFISFPPRFFFLLNIHTAHTQPRSVPHRHTKCERTRMHCFPFELRSQTYNNPNTDS